jgi:hypothetical protein
MESSPKVGSGIGDGSAIGEGDAVGLRVASSLVGGNARVPAAVDGVAAGSPAQALAMRTATIVAAVGDDRTKGIM